MPKKRVMPRKVAVYCRADCEDDAAIGRQATIIKVYAKEHGIDNLEMYVDNGVSGDSLDRPALNRLDRHIGEGRIKMVIVTDLSRIGRNPFETTDWVRGIRFTGVRFISVQDGITADTFNHRDWLFELLSKHPGKLSYPA